MSKNENIDTINIETIIQQNSLQWTRIHPALDFTAEHAFVGNKEATNNIPNTFLIKDDKTLIPCAPIDLANQRIELQPPRCTSYPKWSEESITNYLQETAPTVEPNELYQETKNPLVNYMDLPDERLYDYLALWNIGTYYFPLFNSYPYVFLNGPSESGKSKLMTLCSCLSFNGKFSLHTNTPGIFRMIDRNRCTLFIDEREAVSSRLNSEFRTMLLGGYKRGGLVQRMIWRENDDDYIPIDYPTYSPKMLANIAGIDNVLESRCMTIHMQRGTNVEKTTREVNINDTLWQQIRDKQFLFLMDNWKMVRQAYTDAEAVEGISGRAWELWRPMFSLATLFGESTLANMRTLALETVAERRLDNADSHENLLIEALQTAVTEDQWYSLGEIKRVFASHLENGGWVSEQYIGRMLRSFGFRNRRRMNHGFEYYITVETVARLAQSSGVA
ncbi:MAG: hypothetical protein NWF01_05785 [Candidatus Bathyarchaeota archaeon]|nr:hypothetical protein [Candidatus Bathyarchaeota archaeon]